MKSHTHDTKPLATKPLTDRNIEKLDKLANAYVRFATQLGFSNREIAQNLCDGLSTKGLRDLLVAK